MRVLVVDDEPGIRRQLTFLLEDEGFDVTAVESGSLALKAAEEASFDVVILDVRLPDIPGTRVFSTLVDRGAQSHVIIISGHAVQDDVRDARSAGAQFLSKPLDTQRLLELMGNWRPQKEGEQG